MIIRDNLYGHHRSGCVPARLHRQRALLRPHSGCRARLLQRDEGHRIPAPCVSSANPRSGSKRIRCGFCAPSGSPPSWTSSCIPTPRRPSRPCARCSTPYRPHDSSTNSPSCFSPDTANEPSSCSANTISWKSSSRYPHTGKRIAKLALASTDRRLKENKPVTPGFLIAAFLWQEYLDRLEPTATTAPRREDDPASTVIAAQQSTIAIPRRHGWFVRDVWHLQPLLARRTARDVARCARAQAVSCRVRLPHDSVCDRRCSPGAWRSGGRTPRRKTPRRCFGNCPPDVRVEGAVGAAEIARGSRPT